MFSWLKSKISGDKPTTKEEVSQEVASAVAPAEKSWTQRLKSSLQATSQKILGPLSSLFSKESLSPEDLKHFKRSLIESDLGSKLVAEILKIVEKEKDPQICREMIKQKLHSLCLPCDQTLLDKKVVLMVGVNGAGKTTTSAKLTMRFADRNPILIAADTYRAAAVEQLQSWAQRSNVDFFFKEDLLDPAAVTYAGLDQAKESQNNLAIVDTSGRLHTSKNLMNELRKIKKVVLKQFKEEKILTLLTLDASQGQNMARQVEVFNEYINVDGLVITKLDGTSKGGAVFDIMAKYEKPVYFIGCGESFEDLQPFEKDEFIDALF